MLRSSTKMASDQNSAFREMEASLVPWFWLLDRLARPVFGASGRLLVAAGLVTDRVTLVELFWFKLLFEPEFWPEVSLPWG